MNFRLIVEYHDTGVITEQYFPDMDSNSWDYAGWYQLPEWHD